MSNNYDDKLDKQTNKLRAMTMKKDNMCLTLTIIEIIIIL